MIIYIYIFATKKFLVILGPYPFVQGTPFFRVDVASPAAAHQEVRALKLRGEPKLRTKLQRWGQGPGEIIGNIIENDLKMMGKMGK